MSSPRWDTAVPSWGLMVSNLGLRPYQSLPSLRQILALVNALQSLIGLSVYDVLNLVVTPKAIKSRVTVKDMSSLPAKPRYSDRVSYNRSLPATILTASPYKRKRTDKFQEQDKKKVRTVKMLTSTEKKDREREKDRKREKKLRKLIETEIKSKESKITKDELVNLLMK